MTTSVRLALIALLFAALAIPVPAAGQGAVDQASISYNGGTISGDVAFQRVVASSSVTSGDRRGMGKYAGFYMIAPPVDIEAQDLTDASDGSKLAFASSSVALYKWNEEQGWLGYSSPSNTLSRFRAGMLFLYDNGEDNFDGGFKINQNAPAEELSSTSIDVTADASKNSWLLSVPHHTDPYYDPSEITVGGSPLPAEFAEHVQMWDPAEKEWVLTSFADSLADFTDRTLYTFRRSLDGFYAEAHTQATHRVDYPESGIETAYIDTLSAENGIERADVAAGSINFRLFLISDNGTKQTRLDDNARLYFYHLATEGTFDRYDATKLSPQRGRYAAIGLEGTKFGSPRVQRVLSVPHSPSLPVEKDMRLAVRNLRGTLSITAYSENVPTDWAVKIVDTKGTSDTADDDSTTIGALGNGYQFKVNPEREPAPGPAPMILEQSAAEAGEQARFDITLDKESDL